MLKYNKRRRYFNNVTKLSIVISMWHQRQRIRLNSINARILSLKWWVAWNLLKIISIRLNYLISNLKGIREILIRNHKLMINKKAIINHLCKTIIKNVTIMSKAKKKKKINSQIMIRSKSIQSTTNWIQMKTWIIMKLYTFFHYHRKMLSST